MAARGHLTVIQGGETPSDGERRGIEREALAALVAVTSEWASELPPGSHLQGMFLRLRNAGTRLLNIPDGVFLRRMLRSAGDG